MMPFTDNRAGMSCRRGFLLLALLATAGCAGLPPQSWPVRAAAEPVELAAVPFFPQDDYQCGPAALATVLNWSGVEVTDEDLTPYLYIPVRQGALQAELVAQARARGRLAYELRAHPDALLAELRAGHPVLVLQNNGLSWLPKWHYAVVVGYDAAGNVILRSGETRRHVLAADVFMRTWQRGDYWSLLVLPPGRIPASAEPAAYAEAVTALEVLNPETGTVAAWRAGVARWPDDLTLGFGLGNALYAQGDLQAAERAFHAVLEHHTGAAAVWNNLAQVLADQARWTEAEAAARWAVELGGPFAAEFKNTLDAILESSDRQN